MTMPVSHVTVRVPLTIRRRPGRKTLVSLGFGADGGRIASKADQALLKALARAFRYQKLRDEGRYASISEMATAEKIERGYLGTLLRLTLLAPEMLEAILNARQPEGATLPALLEGVPVGWGSSASNRVHDPSSMCAPSCLDPPQRRLGPPECRLMKTPKMANMPVAGIQPELQPEDKTMAWKTPKIVEVSLASEINCYACAEIG